MHVICWNVVQTPKFEIRTRFSTTGPNEDIMHSMCLRLSTGRLTHALDVRIKFLDSSTNDDSASYNLVGRQAHVSFCGRTNYTVQCRYVHENCIRNKYVGSQYYRIVNRVPTSQLSTRQL